MLPPHIQEKLWLWDCGPLYLCSGSKWDHMHATSFSHSSLLWCAWFAGTEQTPCSYDLVSVGSFFILWLCCSSSRLPLMGTVFAYPCPFASLKWLYPCPSPPSFTGCWEGERSRGMAEWYDKVRQKGSLRPPWHGQSCPWEKAGT